MVTGKKLKKPTETDQVDMTARKTKPETVPDSEIEKEVEKELEKEELKVSQVDEKIKKVVEELVQRSKETGTWASADILTVQGSRTSLTLTFSVNAQLGAVMFTVHTPKLANKPNMIKLPTTEHVDLLIQLVDKMKEKKDKLVKLYETACELLGVDKNRVARRTTRETIEL